MVEQAIDKKRVYVFGYSNGGHMAFRLAMEAPDEIAAVAAVAASLPTPDDSSCPLQAADPINLPRGNSHPIRLCEQRLCDVIHGIGTETA